MTEQSEKFIPPGNDNDQNRDGFTSNLAMCQESVQARKKDQNQTRADFNFKNRC